MSLSKVGVQNLKSELRTSIPLKLGDRVVATTAISEKKFRTLVKDHIHCLMGDIGKVIELYTEINNIKHYEYPTVRFERSGTATVVEYNANQFGDFTKNGSNEIIKVNK